MSPRINRRRFVKTATGLAVAAGAAPIFLPSRAFGANERLNIGVIGVGGRGAGDLQGVASQNIVALCDVDENRLNAAASKLPAAKKYFDYRKLLEQKNLDAIVVATPDHHH
ncbi:MAG: Gfo/Idh/MocA family oxidoreductase, partial [Pirellulaceae bacterium]|nr:Gfo/Idh/MocA family oxidoreductase [Pirellulaceae bacterium]